MTSRERMSIPRNFNKLQLINLVRARPALWDKTDERYRHKVMKRTAWQEICRTMKKDYDKLNGTERQKYYLWTLKVWRHTRDTWCRSLKARKKANKSGTFMRPYKYDKEMAFLKKVKSRTDGIATESDIDDEADEEEEKEGVKEVEEGVKEEVIFELSESGSDPLCDNENECNDDNTDDEWNAFSEEGIVTEYVNHDNAINEIENTFKTKDNRTNGDLIDSKMKAYLNQIQNMKEINGIQEDRHFAFFKSVHPSLMSLDDYQILQYQLGVVNLLRNIKYGDRCTHVTSDQRYFNAIGGHYMQPGVPAVSQQPVAASNITHDNNNIASGSVGTSFTPLIASGSAGTSFTPLIASGSAGTSSTPLIASGSAGTSNTPLITSGSTGTSNTPLIASGSAGTSFTPLRIVLDPLKTD